MIPAQIDVLSIIADLREWGWLDFKIEEAAGLGSGYIAQVRAGNIREPAYGKAARLFNFWEEAGALHVKHQDLQTRVSSVTT